MQEITEHITVGKREELILAVLDKYGPMTRTAIIDHIITDYDIDIPWSTMRDALTRLVNYRKIYQYRDSLDEIRVGRPYVYFSKL